MREVEIKGHHLREIQPIIGELFGKNVAKSSLLLDSVDFRDALMSGAIVSRGSPSA